jgi:hypothetical protein
LDRTLYHFSLLEVALHTKPSGIDERPEQIRPPVIKGVGVTPSELYLARLAENSFLNLWSYPSPFRDQRSAKGTEGKELCDLLVVCGSHIIIFSEKTIEWPLGDLNTAWCRWARRAVQDSAKQASGAERWITEYSERVFLDRNCTKRFPIDFPAQENRIFHRVLVSRGASKACQDHLGTSSGSLITCPSIKGDAHWNSQTGRILPFALGDIDPEGSFVHVFDEVALDIVLRELDTVRDFTDYLVKRAEFIRSGKLHEAHGEENLLAYYAIRINDDGDHDFVLDGDQVPITIDRSRYANLISDPRYLAKKHEDKNSYLWDILIEGFTTHMLDGTSITIDDFRFDLRRNEVGVRYMALASRFHRRALGQAAMGALEEGKTKDRFFRVILPAPKSKDNETAFFIQTYKYLDWMENKGGYEQYRRKRTESAVVYAKGLLERYPHLERVVGISREPPAQGQGVSEDLVYAEQSEWTYDERRAILEDCEKLGVLQNMKERTWDSQEFPDVETITFDHPLFGGRITPLNRQERRKLEAKKRKRPR